MNFFAYLESRFVKSQIDLQNKVATATGGLSVNHAAKAHMWIALKLATFFHFFVIPLQYLGQALHLSVALPAAHQMAREANEARAAKEAEAKKVSDDVLRQVMKDRAEKGLDALNTKGNS